ncbi:DNA polymerase IV [Mycoplasmopsis agassizii]|uniref:Y-family DNA polymerase n=1 Tax=Mycoplasmopsis agassizii TaxID=33922 RepID=UPI003527D481
MKSKKMDLSQYIFHIDMDSFFASAIATVRPELKGKKVAVATNNLRAIVAAASYEAKACGVKIAKPVYQAKHVCPDVIIVPPDFALFNKLSTGIFEYLAFTYSVPIQIYSIDECYMNVTSLISKDMSPKKLALQIQNQILSEFDIPVSIGISHNLWNAKMSSPLNKPLGISVTKPSKMKDILYPLPIDDFFGIGKSSSEKLKKLGIKTIGDFCTFKVHYNILEAIFKGRFQGLIENCQGLSSNFVDEDANLLKGIGNSETFDYDLSSYEDLVQELSRMVDRAWKRLKSRALYPYSISVSLRSQEKKWTSKQHIFKEAINTKESALKEAIKLFEKLWKEETQRGIGVSFSKLVNKFEQRENNVLFEEYDEETRMENKVKKIVQSVNKNFKNKAVFSGQEYLENQTLNKKRQRFLKDDFSYKNESIK